MNRNEAIAVLRVRGEQAFGSSIDRWTFSEDKYYPDMGGPSEITESDVFGAESLQSRIETLLNMKFETEDALLETVGSLWGGADVLVDNHTDCQVAHRRLPDGAIEVQVTRNGEAHMHVSEAYGSPLRNTNELIPYRQTYRESQHKTYWDGVEPLRVGHIVEQGTVEYEYDNEYFVMRTNGSKTVVREPQPHPFAKYTEQERRFVEQQIELGVLSVC